MQYDKNPFPEADADRHAIWEMMVHRDIDAYLAHDWSMIADDFIDEGFIGVDAHKSGNPDSWRLNYSKVSEYRDLWLAMTIDQADYAEELRPALFRVTVLRDIEINGDKAIAHKKFDGRVKRTDGTDHVFSWQSIAFLNKRGGKWRFVGFVGYLPNPISL